MATSQDAAILSITKKIWLPRVLWQAKVHWAEATFGRTANADIFSSYRLSRPIIILFVAGPSPPSQLVPKHKSYEMTLCKWSWLTLVATFGRTANALLILSAQPPHHYLVVAGPQFEGKRKHRSVKKSGQEQMTNEWPPAKQLVVGANAQYYQKNVETSNELRIQTLHGYRGGGIVQHWLHGQ